MKSKITSLTRPSHFTLPLSNIVLQFTHPHQPGSIQEMLRSPHASELALHQGERGRGLRCTLRTRRRLCGGGLPRRATLRCRWLRRRLRRRLRSAAGLGSGPGGVMGRPERAGVAPARSRHVVRGARSVVSLLWALQTLKTFLQLLSNRANHQNN